MPVCMWKSMKIVQCFKKSNISFAVSVKKKVKCLYGIIPYSSKDMH